MGRPDGGVPIYDSVRERAAFRDKLRTSAHEFKDHLQRKNPRRFSTLGLLANELIDSLRAAELNTVSIEQIDHPRYDAILDIPLLHGQCHVYVRLIEDGDDISLKIEYYDCQADPPDNGNGNGYH